MLETQDLKDFSITNWYEQFKNVTIKTIIINLPIEVLDKFKLGCTGSEVEEACSEDFLNHLKIAIKSQNSSSFVKNNWHAPADSKIISFGYTLTVTNLDDLFLYLTGSTIISNDFCNDKYDSFCIALRPWLNIHPASEFRCIVINNVLRGITPRDWPTFYAHFSDDGPNIIRAVAHFYETHVREKFCRQSYVFDIIMSYPESVTLVDFGPLNNKSNLYAFSWKEIQVIIKKGSREEVAPVFRYLESDIGIMTRNEALIKVSQSQAKS